MEHSAIIKLSNGWVISLPGILSQNSFIPLSHGQRLDMFIYEAISEISPICQMKLMDSIGNEMLSQNSYGAFIIPLGLENSWQYTTHEGQDEILSQAEVSRLLLISLSDLFSEENIGALQYQFTEAALKFVPPLWLNSEIPFMTSEETGEKSLVYRIHDMIVEDIGDGDTYKRQLIFLSNPKLIQSEIRLKCVEDSENSLFSVGSCAVKWGNKIEPDYDFLTFECQRAFLVSLAFNLSKALNEISRILILGAGGCVLPTFFLKHFPNFEITAVDLNGELIDVCKRFFGVPNDNRLQIIIQDALNFVEASNNIYDLILLDICIALPGEPTPPMIFVDQSFLQKLYSLISDSGVLSINLIGNDGQIKKIIECVSLVFPYIYRNKCKEDSNQVIYCLKHEVDELKNIEKNMSEIERSKNWDLTMALAEYSTSIRKIEATDKVEKLLGPKSTKKKKRKK
ncbi:unnamed protein product [Blepharisma stoltei]|uniref:Spermine synthase n=1 Tax=Blepharisma stoltei TaxID=1481888 RepID=A0AAU9JVP2_9CILI|nr:unnamed protein product [Blepharisma stoltei]